MTAFRVRLHPLVSGFFSFFDREEPRLVSELHIFENTRQVSECRWGSTGVHG
jgi:hypothetical protein